MSFVKAQNESFYFSLKCHPLWGFLGIHIPSAQFSTPLCSKSNSQACFLAFTILCYSFLPEYLSYQLMFKVSGIQECSGSILLPPLLQKKGMSTQNL